MKQIILGFFLAMALMGFKSSFAGIVYTDINDTTIEVNATPGSTKYFNLDLNNDGSTDFKISLNCFESWQGYHPPHTAFKTSIRRINGGQIAAGPFFNNDTISSTLDYWNQIDIYGNIPGLGIIGRWAYKVKQESRDMYLALKIIDNGDVYYGWVNLKVGYNSFTVCSYAYNNVSDASILAGQTN